MKFNKEHVEQAFKKITQNGFSPNRESTKWDIIDPVTGKRFPPKAVLRVAKEIAKDTSYSGGGGPATNGPLRALGFDILLKAGLERSDEANDIRDILNSKRDETTKTRLINARLGQGGFREALIEIWSGKCALTGCSIPTVLRASHIKPWSESNDAERLDASNGILLAASIDALFDKFLITFKADGALQIADDQNFLEVERLGIRRGQKIEFSSKSQGYLNWHREEFCRSAIARQISCGSEDH